MSITTSIREIELAHGGRVFVSRTKTKDVVSIEGSVFGGSNMLPDSQSEAPGIAAELLDAGTATRSKEVIRGTLSKLGATLSFSAGGDRMYFSASCFPEDVPTVLTIAFDCLSNATFPQSELKSVQARALGELTEQKTDTRAQAGIALAQGIYDSTHPNYRDTTAVRMKKVKAVTQKDLRAYGKLLGRGGLVVSIVGDIEPVRATAVVEKSAKLLKPGTATQPAKKPNTLKHRKDQILISIPDKANIDVYLGASVPLTSDHPLYIAFGVFASLLGGRGLSTGHLMRTIRERDGYTYGIYALPGGFEDKSDGHFIIWATFSPDTFEKALIQTHKEIEVFLATGITKKSLEKKKTEIIGRYLLGLSTTRGLASALHGIGVEGRPLSYLDEYQEKLKALTVADVVAATSLVPLKSLRVAAAGTFKK